MHQQVSSTAEPGQEYCDGHRIEQRKMPSMPMAAAMSCSMADVKVSMARNVKMEVQGAADKRNGGKCKAHNETNQIEKFPVHKLSLTHLRRALRLRLRTQHVQQLLRQFRRFQDRVHQHQTTARILMLGQVQQRAADRGIAAETLRPLDQPQV